MLRVSCKVFARFVRKERLSDRQNCEAISRAVAAAIDAELGSNLIKPAHCRVGAGRSGGYVRWSLIGVAA